MYGQIKQIVKESMEEINAKILIGSVSNVTPLSVLVEQRLELPSEVLIFPEHLQEKTLITKDWKTHPCSGGDIGSGGSISEIQRVYTLIPKVQVGDKLILINLGDKYLIFDRVGDVNATITITE